MTKLPQRWAPGLHQKQLREQCFHYHHAVFSVVSWAAQRNIAVNFYLHAAGQSWYWWGEISQLYSRLVSGNRSQRFLCLPNATLQEAPAYLKVQQSYTKDCMSASNSCLPPSGV